MCMHRVCAYMNVKGVQYGVATIKYGVATISRLLEIISLFCKRAL